MHLCVPGIRGPVSGGKHDGCFKVLGFDWSCPMRWDERADVTESARIRLGLEFCDPSQVLLWGLKLCGAEFPVATLSVAHGETETAMTFHNVIFAGSSLACNQAVNLHTTYHEGISEDSSDDSTDSDSDALASTDEQEPKETLLKKLSLCLDSLSMTQVTTSTHVRPIRVPSDLKNIPHADNRDCYLQILSHLNQVELLNIAIASKMWLLIASDARLLSRSVHQWHIDMSGEHTAYSIDGFRMPQLYEDAPKGAFVPLPIDDQLCPVKTLFFDHLYSPPTKKYRNF